MASNADYLQLLRDPRWQRKRLEIMERDSWKCQDCKSGDATLNVHHIRYAGRNPWDVDSQFLTTLCQACHVKRTSQKKVLKATIELLELYDPASMDVALGFVRGLLVAKRLGVCPLENDRVARGLGLSCGLDTAAVKAVKKDSPEGPVVDAVDLKRLSR
jgi:hypothetical protein